MKKDLKADKNKLERKITKAIHKFEEKYDSCEVTSIFVDHGGFYSEFAVLNDNVDDLNVQIVVTVK